MKHHNNIYIVKQHEDKLKRIAAHDDEIDVVVTQFSGKKRVLKMKNSVIEDRDNHCKTEWIKLQQTNAFKLNQDPVTTETVAWTNSDLPPFVNDSDMDMDYDLNSKDMKVEKGNDAGVYIHIHRHHDVNGILCR